MLLVVVLYALFGFSFTLGKIILNYTQPLFAVGIRMSIAGLMLMGYVIARHKMSCYPRKNDWPYYLQLIFFSVFIPYVFRQWALQYVPTSKAALLFNLMPFFTAVWSYVFNGERLNRLQLLGLALGFLGMVPILITASPGEIHFTSLCFLSLSELAIIIAVASLSYGLIIMQKMVKHRACPPYLANSVSMFFGGCLALNFSFACESNLIHGRVMGLIAILALQIIISNMTCANLQAYLLKKYSPTFMSFASFLGPLFTCIYGSFLFNEEITWHFFASFFTVILGLLLYRYNDNE